MTGDHDMGNESDGTAAPGPLSGIRVLDFSVMISGPLAAMTLADQGAEVIKIETPGLGDLMRLLGSNKGGLTGIFLNNNRGKRSLVVNLKSDRGRDVVTRLIAESDVLIQNFRPGAMERLGLGWDDARAINPDLVYVSISGYGPTGPQSNRRVYDQVIQAAAGYADVQTDPTTGRPVLLRTLVCDKATSLTAAQAITAALLARERGLARGQHITLAMLDAAIAFLWPDAAMDAVLLDDDVMRTGTIGSGYAVTALKDGFCAGGTVSDSEFTGWCAAIGHPELASDPRFATTLDRVMNARELAPLLLEYALETHLDDFLAAAEEHDVPASKINSITDLATDAQVVHNEVFVEREHPVAGRVREPRPAPVFSATPARPGRHAPLLGEHSDDIVRELGLDPDDLRAEGAIA
jgi:crotonobetainyl-CoA:carnitine CoA-transferase CaiB-like acyl-CoA transferase